MRKLDIIPWVKVSILGFPLSRFSAVDFLGVEPGTSQVLPDRLLVFLTAIAQLWINHPETFQKKLSGRLGVWNHAVSFFAPPKLIMVFCSDPRGGNARPSLEF